MDELTPEQALRKMREMQRKMNKGKKSTAKPAPGATDQELYPTDQGLVDFRLARRGRKRSGPTVA